jgi:hypothetical protein
VTTAASPSTCAPRRAASALGLRQRAMASDAAREHLFELFFTTRSGARAWAAAHARDRHGPRRDHSGRPRRRRRRGRRALRDKPGCRAAAARGGPSSDEGRWKARGRAPPVRFEAGWKRQGEGSCLYRAGAPSVLCVASVEEGVKDFLRGRAQGWVTAEYLMHPRAGARRQSRDGFNGRPLSGAPRRSRGSSAARCAPRSTSRPSASAPSPSTATCSRPTAARARPA